MVTRYDFYYSDMWEEDDGNYVKYEDYAKLQAQLTIEQSCNRCGQYHGKEPCDDVAKLQAQVDELKEGSRIDTITILDYSERNDELQAQVDRVIKVRDWLSTQCTNSHAVKALDKAIKGDGDG